MKQIFTILTLLILGSGAYAQNSNFIVFSQDGQPFTVIVNGERMNEVPLTNMKVSDLNMPNYKVRVIFSDPALAPIDKVVYVEPGMEYSYQIKTTNKGEIVMRLFSQVEVAQAPPPPATQTVVVWGAPQPAVATQSVSQSSSTTTTTTTSSSSSTVSSGVSGGGVSMGVSAGYDGGSVGMVTPDGEVISMGVSISDDGSNVNMNMNMGGTGMGSSSSVTTTTTTTTTTSGTPVYTEPAPAVVECLGMGLSDYESAKSSIESKSFEDSKLTVAKQIVNANSCISASQVKGIMDLFSFEDTKLEFAKFAYDHCTDRQNYYKVNDAFTFETTIEDLDEYIQSRR